MKTKTLHRTLILLLALALFASPASATIYYAQNSSVNIDSANEWNDAADGSGNVLTWANLAASDILAANGKTAIAINVDFTCLRISTAAEGTGAAGGGFTISTARTIHADIACAGVTNTCVSASHTTGNTITWYGNLTGSAANSNTNAFANTSTGRVDVYGNLTGGSIGSSTRAFSNNSTGIVNIYGNVSAGSAASSQGLYNVSTGIVTITGNIINNSASSATAGVIVYNPGATNYIEYPKPTSGTFKYGKTIPAADILDTATPDGVNAPAAGTYHEATAAEVQEGVTFGPLSAYIGTFAGGIAPEDIVAPAFVLTGHFNYVGGSAGTYVPVAAKNVKKGIRFGAGSALKGSYSPGTSGGMR